MLDKSIAAQVLDLIAATDYPLFDLSEDDVEKFYQSLIKNDSHHLVRGYKNGAFKIVLFLTSAPYVIKIPFGYSWELDEPCPDTCSPEVSIYQDALEWGVAESFSETALIGYIHNYPIYCQPAILFTFEYNKTSGHISPHNMELSKRLYNDNSYTPPSTFIAETLECFGEQYTAILMHFIQEHQLVDLHNANVGYTASATPIIIDYGGY